MVDLPGPRSPTTEPPRRVLTYVLRRPFLLWCGVLTGVLYVMGVSLAPLGWAGYDPSSQVISELTAIDSPTRSLVLGIFTVHGVLLCAFCVGYGIRVAVGHCV